MQRALTFLLAALLFALPAFAEKGGKREVIKEKTRKVQPAPKKAEKKTAPRVEKRAATPTRRTAPAAVRRERKAAPAPATPSVVRRERRATPAPVLQPPVSRPARKLLTVRIGYTPAVASLPFFVAMEKGFFTQVGLNAEPLEFVTAEAAADALRYNEVEAVAGTALWTWFKMEDKEPGEFALFLPSYETAAEPVSFLLVKPNSAIKETADLKGKTVATYLSEMQEFYQREYLAKKGLAPDENVFAKGLPPGKQLEALYSGEVEALFAVEPYAAVAQTRGIARVLEAGVRPAYLGDPFWSTAAAFSRRYLKTDVDTAEKIRRALEEAVVWLRKDPAGAKEILARYLMLDAASAQRCGIYRWRLASEDIDYAPLRGMAETMQANGFLIHRIDPADIFDASPRKNEAEPVTPPGGWRKHLVN